MKSNKLIFIALSFVLVLVIGGVIIFKNITAEYPINNTGKYAYYILQAEAENEKIVKKRKINNIEKVYTNVIYEKEKDKKDLALLNDNDIIAEYLVCILAKADDKIYEDYYLCKIPYVKYKNTLNDQLNIAKLDIDSIISDGIKGGTDIAGAVAGSSKSNKKVEKGTSSKIGNVVGGFIGGLLDKKEAGEQVGEFVGDIAPSVIDAVKDVWTNVTNQNKENEIKLNEFISLMSEEDYRGTLEQFASIMKPNISSIDKLDLNKYLTSGSINLLNKTINKIVK